MRLQSPCIDCTAALFCLCPADLLLRNVNQSEICRVLTTLRESIHSHRVQIPMQRTLRQLSILQHRSWMSSLSCQTSIFFLKAVAPVRPLTSQESVHSTLWSFLCLLSGSFFWDDPSRPVCVGYKMSKWCLVVFVVLSGCVRLFQVKTRRRESRVHITSLTWCHFVFQGTGSERVVAGWGQISAWLCSCCCLQLLSPTVSSKA